MALASAIISHGTQTARSQGSLFQGKQCLPHIRAKLQSVDIYVNGYLSTVQARMF